MNPKDYEICDRGQDGIAYHAMIYVYEGRVCMVAGYDHEGPAQGHMWESILFESAFGNVA